MDKRIECTYKDKCYRKKIEHFEKFKHNHLVELLEKIGNHEIHVPFGHTPNVSFNTLKTQLEYERKIRGANLSEESEPEVKRARPSKQNVIGSESNPNSPNASSSIENNKSSTALKEKPLKSDLNDSQEISTNSSHTQKSPQPGPSKKTFEKQRVGGSRHSANMREAEAFRVQVQSQIQNNIGDKLRAAHPYNILYTTLYVPPNAPRNNTDRLAITFSELLDTPLGLLENSLLINFMVQFGWLLACYFTMGHSNKPMTLLYGEVDTELGTKFNSFLKHVKVKPPSPFGSHHTKMMIYQYLDKSIRIVVCTANLVESDWANRTQGVWISEKCEELLPGDTGGDSRTNFKRDILAYLQSYNLPVLVPWIEKVKKADMSHLNVFFIGSIPGSYKVAEGNWGQARLRAVLKKHAPVVENNKYKVIAQISSIGSLGPNPDSWLMNDMLTTFSMTKSSQSILARPSLAVIYPSFVNVENSIDGLIGGGCLPYSSTTHRKQEWLSNYLHHWKSDTIGRTLSVPHIKSYTRVSPDHSRISYFLLTSANLSKAAWGTISKSQSVSILSYEAGVLLLPEYLFGSGDYFPLEDEVDENGEVKPLFPLPYDLPLSPYGINDIPWFIDNLPSC